MLAPSAEEAFNDGGNEVNNRQSNEISSKNDKLLTWLQSQTGRIRNWHNGQNGLYNNRNPRVEPENQGKAVVSEVFGNCCAMEQKFLIKFFSLI